MLQKPAADDLRVSYIVSKLSPRKIRLLSYRYTRVFFAARPLGAAAKSPRKFCASATVANKRYACIGLFNPKSPENVGSVMRAAGCYSAASVFYSGKRYARARDFITDTQRIYMDIPLIGVEDLQQIIPIGCTPVAVELVEGARPLPQYTHPDRAIYIFGPEDGSLSKEVLDWCEDVIYIPTQGCMNLAATVNVVLYDRMAKGINTKSGPGFK
ncbi:hypothetical protein PSEUDO8BK_40575 [Pseudomonas sp. 8BK]|nr:hypothetical protein PSEUDO8BK_40575 [Pseudomonas sp. 8BK]